MSLSKKLNLIDLICFYFYSILHWRISTEHMEQIVHTVWIFWFIKLYQKLHQLFPSPISIFKFHIRKRVQSFIKKCTRLKPWSTETALHQCVGLNGKRTCVQINEVQYFKFNSVDFVFYFGSRFQISYDKHIQSLINKILK